MSATRPPDRGVLVRGRHQAVDWHLAASCCCHVTDLSASSLALMADGQPREWRETEVATIRQRRGDSLANGALIGLGIGAGVTAIGIAVWVNSDTYEGEVTGGEAVMVTAIYGGLGAAIGTGIDALITRRRVVFEKRPARHRISDRSLADANADRGSAVHRILSSAPREAINEARGEDSTVSRCADGWPPPRNAGPRTPLL